MKLWQEHHCRSRLGGYRGVYSTGLMILIAVLVLTAGCSPQARPNTPGTTNADKSVSPPAAGTPEAANNGNPSSASDTSSSVRLTAGNLPDWFTNDLKLASNVKFPSRCDGYAWNRNMSDITNNYIERIKDFDFWQVTGIHGQLWIAGYTGATIASSYSTYAGPFDMKNAYQQMKSGSSDYYWGSLTPVLFFESNKITFVPAVSWDRANAIWIAFAPGQVIIKSNHDGVDLYEVFNVPGIVIPGKP